MREISIASFIKLGWKLLVEEDNLWPQILQAKYCKNHRDVDIFENRVYASNMWCKIAKIIKHLKQGVRTKVGNGKRPCFGITIE